jgi:curli biogenesis system outer membrane secretion channel CsgG
MVRKILFTCGLFGTALLVITLAVPIADVSAQPAAAQKTSAAPALKRKIAVGRFSNATNYGRALLLPGEADPFTKQASDMLVARLTDSGRFLVFERGDLDVVQKEQSFAPGQPALVVGADTLVIGSITEFGRKTEGKVGFLSSAKKQTAFATVEVRLVDVRTGQAFFSTKGSGSIEVEAKETLGFGSRAAYDSTLNDKAIDAAVSDLMNNIVEKLGERPWHTDILRVANNQVIISGGPSQGLKVGDVLQVEQPGDIIVSSQSGLPITLPGQPVAQIRIASFFGEGDAEGAVAVVTSGTVQPEMARTLSVKEIVR